MSKCNSKYFFVLLFRWGFVCGFYFSTFPKVKIIPPLQDQYVFSTGLCLYLAKLFFENVKPISDCAGMNLAHWAACHLRLWAILFWRNLFKCSIEVLEMLSRFENLLPLSFIFVCIKKKKECRLVSREVISVLRLDFTDLWKNSKYEATLHWHLQNCSFFLKQN